MDKLQLKLRLEDTTQGFLDFIVNGESLKERFHEANQLVGALDNPMDDRQSMLLGCYLDGRASPVSTGRVPLYFCHLCGDIDCGVLSVRITFEGDVVRWNDFWFECDYEEGPHRKCEYQPEYSFALVDYRSAFRGIASKVGVA